MKTDGQHFSGFPLAPWLTGWLFWGYLAFYYVTQFIFAKFTGKFLFHNYLEQWKIKPVCVFEMVLVYVF